MCQSEIRTNSGNKNFKIAVKTGFHHKKVFGGHVENESIERLILFDKYLTRSGYFKRKYSPILEYSTTGNRFVTRKYVDGDHYNFSTNHLEECLGLFDELLKVDVMSPHSSAVNVCNVGDYISELSIVEHPKLSNLVARELIENLLNYLQDKSCELSSLLSINPHIIHGDIQSQNLVFSEGKLVSVIDWDEVKAGSFPYDIGKSYWQLCKVGRGNFELSTVLSNEYIRHFLKRFTAEQLKLIFLVGATYFIPSVQQVAKVKENDNLLHWYIGWVAHFWGAFRSNMNLTSRLLNK
ncbi:phosphotransferase [Xenorhabdus miraniensis]|uniref:Aminoglycoside phosphotransferase domain-containing protein n=1 Tax=Xenorhabdus miraniensis TaxID=351674 RepID=A0A2D0JJX0_9GAMM|nr:phosphotransferase [Xenorhabdus miraniensis]PHM45583.1 hypothetical protein Xmir_04262 [Xenorhabdus miraniensis]